MCVFVYAFVYVCMYVYVVNVSLVCAVLILFQDPITYLMVLAYNVRKVH